MSCWLGILVCGSQCTCCRDSHLLLLITARCQSVLSFFFQLFFFPFRFWACPFSLRRGTSLEHFQPDTVLCCVCFEETEHGVIVCPSPPRVCRLQGLHGKEKGSGLQSVSQTCTCELCGPRHVSFSELWVFCFVFHLRMRILLIALNIHLLGVLEMLSTILFTLLHTKHSQICSPSLPTYTHTHSLGFYLPDGFVCAASPDA